MAQFYAEAAGRARTIVHRLGDKTTGVRTIAAGWSGAIEVRLHHDYEKKVDMYEVWLTPWQSFSGSPLLLCHGVLDSNINNTDNENTDNEETNNG